MLSKSLILFSLSLGLVLAKGKKAGFMIKSYATRGESTNAWELDVRFIYFIFIRFCAGFVRIPF